MCVPYTAPVLSHLPTQLQLLTLWPPCAGSLGSLSISVAEHVRLRDHPAALAAAVQAVLCWRAAVRRPEPSGIRIPHVSGRAVCVTRLSSLSSPDALRPAGVRGFTVRHDRLDQASCCRIERALSFIVTRLSDLSQLAAQTDRLDALLATLVAQAEGVPGGVVRCAGRGRQAEAGYASGRRFREQVARSTAGRCLVSCAGMQCCAARVVWPAALPSLGLRTL